MSIEARKPPRQIALKIRRVLGGKAGWNGIAVQFAFAAVLGWIGYEIVSNARANLENQHIAAGFGFLANNAGFDVNQTLISYTGSDTFLRVFLVGLLNTLVVSVVGIVFATVIGFIVALCRLSPNWLLSRASARSMSRSSATCRCCSRSCSGTWRCSRPCPIRGRAFRCSASPSSAIAVSSFPARSARAASSRSCAVLALGIVASLALRIHARRALFQRGS